jgi:hypothetical protein
MPCIQRKNPEKVSSVFIPEAIPIMQEIAMSLMPLSISLALIAKMTTSISYWDLSITFGNSLSWLVRAIYPYNYGSLAS